MKSLHYLFVVLLLTTSQLASAQLAKGNLLVGGTAGFTIDFQDDSDNRFSVLVNPTLAKLVTDQLAVGGGLGINYQKVGDFSASAITLLPLVRYYLNSGGSSPVFFIDAQAGLALVRSESFSGETDSEYAFAYAFGPGMAFFIQENISIDAILAYNHVGGDFDQSQLGFNIGFQIFLARGE